MPFHKYGKTVKIPRNDHVDIHVREVVLNADAPEADQVEHIEIREYLKEGQVYGHGLLVPKDSAERIAIALNGFAGV